MLETDGAYGKMLIIQWVTLTFDLAFRSAIRWAKP